MIILIGLGTSILVFLVFFWFFSNADASLKKQQAAVAKVNAGQRPLQNFTISSKDIETIAGDDVIVTQLNLARAYIETERKNLAKSILSNVLVQGNYEQKNEAKRLIDTLQMI